MTNNNTSTTTCCMPFCVRPAFEHAMFEPGRELCGEHYGRWIWAPRARDRLAEIQLGDNDSNTTVLGDERTETWSQ